MYDQKLVKEILIQGFHATEIISKRFAKIKTSDDFLDSDEGMLILDAICMQLIAIGESIKNVDKKTKNSLLINYPDIDWKGVMGIRDIITHHYFDIDAEEIFYVCKNEIYPLMKTIEKIIKSM